MAISKHDKQALADLFINMGVPLVIAMQTVESWSGGNTENLSVRAQNLSKLLTVSVAFATKITKKLEIRDSYTLENVRGKIIQIVTPIVAQNYINTGEIPSEEALRDLTDLFDVLISFADSVSPIDEKGSKPTKIALMIEACEPLLSAIRSDDMGMGHEKAFQECVIGIKTRAEQLAQFLGIGNAVESGLFKSIVPIFVSCYNEASESGKDIGSVWSDCDIKLAMVQGLTAFVGDNIGVETMSGNMPEKLVEKSTPRPKEKVKIQEEKPAKEVKGSEEDNDDDGDDDFNPMSFFSANG